MGSPALESGILIMMPAKPAITTVYADPTVGGGGANPHEICVAILPGGADGPP